MEIGRKLKRHRCLKSLA
uniref:Uncharacterized protein n=1 Tax=Rhizophora mucronata TaxID=61149 RepID=A0A2P2J524_RHIMU